METQRRQFLKTSIKTGIGSIGVALLANPISRALAGDTCELTPPQTSGPFYPGEGRFTADNDLTQIKDRAPAAGKVVIVTGQILDLNCEPVADANVEIWQACESGRYNNDRDPNPAPLDPNFKYWGEAFTDKEGRYEFKTIIPGAYPAADDWDRPPHIHFRVAKRGYKELVTQMYFKGEALNDTDLILLDLVPADREKLIVEFKTEAEGMPPTGKFDITLSPVRRA